LKAGRKVLLYVSVGTLSAVLIAAVGVFMWARWEQHLPAEQTARQQFDIHRADYVYFVSLLRKDSVARFIGSDGSSSVGSGKTRVVPEYRDLMRKIGAKFVTVSEDGSVEFARWGFGCVICSDAYMGVRYSPEDHIPGTRGEWVPKPVNSLENLPANKGTVEDGLYVVKLEPEWFLYRLQINE
jgi:hypothetical protein